MVLTFSEESISSSAIKQMEATSLYWAHFIKIKWRIGKRKKKTKTVFGLTVVPFVSDRMDITHDRYLYMSNVKNKTLCFQAGHVYTRTNKCYACSNSYSL